MENKSNKAIEIGPWKKLSEEIRYENPWIKVSHEEVLQPDGNPGIYGKIHFKNIAIGIVPISQDGYTWLVGQHRYPLDEYSWEIPEGGAPHGESVLAAAQRELQEETGVHARRWTSVLKQHASNSVTDEVAYAFVAQDLRMGETAPDETEELTLARVSLDDAINMAMDGTISDGLAMSALLKVGLMMSRGELIL